MPRVGSHAADMRNPAGKLSAVPDIEQALPKGPDVQGACDVPGRVINAGNAGAAGIHAERRRTAHHDRLVFNVERGVAAFADRHPARIEP